MEEKNWTFVEQKGEGTFAKVVKIWRKDLQCNRAVKKLKNRIDDENDKDYKRFLEECKKMQVLNHPNIVRYYETSLQDGTASVQMEYIEGDTLNKYLKNENYYIPYEEIVKLITGIGSALAYCHVDIYKERMNPTEDKLPLDPNDGSKYVIDSTKEKELIKKYGILHNDLHSGNIIRKEGDNKYVLIDFGLSVNSSDPENSIVFGGAYGFIPPEKWIELNKPKEQRDANNITPAADIYSFGIIIFQMLTGETPFGNSFSAYDGHLHNNPPSIEPLRRIEYENANPGKTYTKDYPDWLEAMVMKCLEKDPKDRYADAKEFMKEYEANIKNDQEKSKNEIKSLKKELDKKKAELDKQEALNSFLEEENQKLKTKNALQEEKLKKTDPHDRATRDRSDNIFASAEDIAAMDLKLAKQKVAESAMALSDEEWNWDYKYSITQTVDMFFFIFIVLIWFHSMALLIFGLEMLEIGWIINNKILSIIIWFISLVGSIFVFSYSLSLLDTFFSAFRKFRMYFRIYSILLFVVIAYLFFSHMDTVLSSKLLLVTWMLYVVTFLLFKLLGNYLYNLIPVLARAKRDHVIIVDRLLSSIDIIFDKYLLYLYVLAPLLIAIILFLHSEEWFWIYNDFHKYSLFIPSIGVVLLLLGLLIKKDCWLTISAYCCFGIFCGWLWYLTGHMNFGISIFELLFVSAMFRFIPYLKKRLNI